MARPLTERRQGGDIPRIQPQATPFDTFIRQPSAGGSQLGQLAQALSGIAPELRQIGGAISERDAAIAAARGEAFAADNEASKDAWAQLKKEGKVSAAQNPHFVLAAKRKFGQVAAQQFRDDMSASLQQLGDNPTPEQFEQAIAETRKAYLESNAGKAGNDLAFMQGFNSVAEQDIDNARRAFAAQHAKQFELKATHAFAQALHADAVKALESGGDIAAVINSKSAEWETVNPDVAGTGTLSASSMAVVKTQVLFDLMRTTRNPELVKRLARQIKSGNGTLADDPTFFTQVEEVADHVTNDQRAKEAHEREQEKKTQADTTDTVTNGLLNAWRTGKAPDTAAAVAALSAVGVKDADVQVQNIVSKLPELDPKFYIGFRSSVARGKMPSVTELTDAVNTNKISQRQYDALLTDIEQAQNAERTASMAGAPTVEAVWSHPAMKIIEQNIREAASAKAEKGLLGNIISYTGFTDTDVQQAVDAAKIDLAQTLAANWSKYGNGAAAAQLASEAWRSYAYQHHIIQWDESLTGATVMPADKGKADEIRQNRGMPVTPASDSTTTSKTPKAPPSYTKGEILQMQTDFAKWDKMNTQQRTAWLSDPRHFAVLTELGIVHEQDIPLIAEKLAAAYKSAQR